MFLLALSNQSPWFFGAFAFFAAATLAYGLATFRRSAGRLRSVASYLFYAAFASTTVMIAAHWAEAERPPFKTMQESLVLFAWCMALVYLVVDRFYRLAWFGAASSGFACLLLVYSVVKADIEVGTLPAALQSVWFVPHVVVYFVGYGALFLATVAAVLHLARPEATLRLETPQGAAKVMSYAGFMHLAILLSFVMLTAGLLLGAVWAKSAWGDYWTWDPKENWALISWLIFVVYLHVRRTRSYTDRLGAWMTLAGFAAVVFTYVGMKLLPAAEASAHVYQ